MIKYRLNLFSAGLEEKVTGESLTIRDRLRKLETYCSRWERFGHVKPIKLGPPPLSTFRKAYASKGFLIYTEDADNHNQNIHFVRLPSLAMEIPLEEWTIWGLPGCAVLRNNLAIHPPSDLLAIPVLHDGGRYVGTNVLVVIHSQLPLARTESRCFICLMANRTQSTLILSPSRRVINLPRRLAGCASNLLATGLLLGFPYGRKLVLLLHLWSTKSLSGIGRRGTYSWSAIPLRSLFVSESHGTFKGAGPALGQMCSLY